MRTRDWIDQTRPTRGRIAEFILHRFTIHLQQRCSAHSTSSAICATVCSGQSPGKSLSHFLPVLSNSTSEVSVFHWSAKIGCVATADWNKLSLFVQKSKVRGHNNFLPRPRQKERQCGWLLFAKKCHNAIVRLLRHQPCQLRSLWIRSVHETTTQ